MALNATLTDESSRSFLVFLRVGNFVRPILIFIVISTRLASPKVPPACSPGEKISNEPRTEIIKMLRGLIIKPSIRVWELTEESSRYDHMQAVPSDEHDRQPAGVSGRHPRGKNETERLQHLLSCFPIRSIRGSALFNVRQCLACMVRPRQLLQISGNLFGLDDRKQLLAEHVCCFESPQAATDIQPPTAVLSTHHETNCVDFRQRALFLASWGVVSS